METSARPCVPARGSTSRMHVEHARQSAAVRGGKAAGHEIDAIDHRLDEGAEQTAHVNGL